MTDTTHDDLVKQACEWRENGSPPEPFYAVGNLIDAMADRIEELEAKLAQQDDLVQAAVAAALTEAADAVTEWLEEYPWHASLTQDILALIRKGGE